MQPSRIGPQFDMLLFVAVLHTLEEDTVEFNWKRNRLFNHTCCLVLYQICMEVRLSENTFYTCMSLSRSVFILLLNVLG